MALGIMVGVMCMWTGLRGDDMEMRKCKVCGEVKPLDVKWVCKKCHYKLDEVRRNA